MESDRARFDRLVEELYTELRKVAGAAMVDQMAAHTLQPTALVHEVWLRLVGSGRLDLSDRKRFLALAARAMRHVLVDHARGKRRQKRGGGALAVELQEDLTPGTPVPLFDILALDEALQKLAQVDPRQVEIVELRYLAGLEVEEVAEVLGISPATVKRDAAMARAWLLARLRGGGPG